MARNFINALIESFTTVNKTCSCVDCSITCRKQEDVSESCSCEDCTEPKTCLYYNKRLNNNQSNTCCRKAQSNAASSSVTGDSLQLRRLNSAKCRTDHSKSTPCCTECTSKTREFRSTAASQICKGSKTPAGLYGIMTETQRKQESVVDSQKGAYLPDSSCSSMISKYMSTLLGSGKANKPPEKQQTVKPEGLCEVMTDTQREQESVVGTQKGAYLPKASGSSVCCKYRSKSQGSGRTTGKQDGLYRVMTETLKQQESVVDTQKGAYLPKASDLSVCCKYRSKSQGSGKTTGKQDGLYRIMTETLRQQESVVDTQKGAYLPKGSGSSVCCKYRSKSQGSGRTNGKPEELYRVMTETLRQQESVVDTQKGAYLPKGSCSKYRSKSRGSGRTTEKPEGVYRVMTETLRQQESVVKIQKGAYLPNGIATACLKYKAESPSEVYAIMTDTLKQQESVVNTQKSAYFTRSHSKYKSKSIKKAKYTDKCTCCHRRQKASVCGNVIIFDTNWAIVGTPRNTYYSPARDTQEVQNLHNSDSLIEPLNMCKKPSKKIQEKGIKNSLDAMSCISCNKVISVTPSNANGLSILSNTEQKNNTLECITMCAASGTSLSSKSTTQHGADPDYTTQVFNINRFETKREIASDTMHMFFKTNSSECNDLSNNEYESPTCSEESHQYKPTKNAQELFKNILKTQGNAIESLMSKNQEKRGKWNTYTAIDSESLKYEYKLPNSLKSRNGYGCYNAAKETSKSSGCLPELQAYKLHELNTREYSLDRFESKKFASDSKNNLITGNEYRPPKCSCNLKDTIKYENKNHLCECTELLRTKSDSPGYVLELANYAHSSNTQGNFCECRESANNNSKSSGSVLEPLISRQEFSNNNILEIQWSGSDSNSSLIKKQSFCDDSKSAINKFESPGYVLELTKSIHKLPSQSSSFECRGSINNDYKFKTELQGYIFELPKYTRENCGYNSDKKCSKSPLDAANNTEEFSMSYTSSTAKSKSIQCDTRNKCKCVVKTQTSEVYRVSEYTIDLCKNILKTQMETIEMLKKIYLPQDQKDFELLRNTSTTLCKDILKKQADTIEVLKKIYLPQFESLTNTCSTLLPNSNTLPDNNINLFKNTALQTETVNFNAKVLVRTPCTEVRDTLAHRQPNITNETKKISKYDIFNRLKEAYKACSCKICDCVVSKPVKTDVCKCKPCDCLDCLNSLSSYESIGREICDCKPCECAQCTKSFAEQCYRAPCQCDDSKTRSIHQCQTLVVAPVRTEETGPRVACNCSPCACIECGLLYPWPSSVVNEMSTSTNRHMLCRCEVCLNESCDQNGLDCCKCQRYNKIMSKPVDYDPHDFDIRTAITVHRNPTIQQLSKNDTIAMFAIVPHKYPINDHRRSNTQTCSCNECECIFCACQTDAVNSIKSSQLFSSNKVRRKSDLEEENNDRSNNCEFTMPSKSQLYKEIQSHDKCCFNVHTSETHLTSSCVCDICNCFICETKPLKYWPKHLFKYGRHRCSDGSRERCFKEDTLGTVVHNHKKGEVLTPSTHKMKIQNLNMQKQHTEAPACSIPKIMTNTDSELQDVDNFHITSEFNTSNKIGFITHANLHLNDLDKCKPIKYDAHINCQKGHKKRNLYKDFTLEKDISRSCYSGNFSSCNKAPSRDKYKIKGKSCNSSGYSQYLEQFPIETIETSSDRIKSKTYETKEKGKITQNSTEKRIVDKISHGNRSRNENNFKMNDCNYLNKNKLMFNPCDSKEQIRRNNYIVKNQTKQEPTVHDSTRNAQIACSRHIYKLELRNSLHVHYVNDDNDKEKNSANSLLQNIETNQLKLTECITENQSSLKRNNENREYINAINDFEEFHATRKMFNISSYPKHTTQSGSINKAEIFIGNNYERVRNTLKKAREFSDDLIELLKTYEKANNEFESVSEKLKLTHASLFSSDFDRRK